jgi:arsenate reductase
MAEALLNDIFGDSFEAFSAGTEPGKINPYVVKVMSELGFDLSRNRTKSVKEFLDQQIDLVVTVCDRAKESCPFFPGAKNYLHHSFTDPSGFTGSEVEILNKVREIRDEIKKWIEENFGDKNE